MLGIIPALLLAALIVWLSSQQGETIVEQQVIRQLSTWHKSKKSEVEAYFKLLTGQVRTYSDDAMVIDAMNSFKKSFKSYREETLTLSGSREKQSLKNHYTQ